MFATQAIARDRSQGEEEEEKNILKADPACGDDVCIVWQAAYKYTNLKPPGDQHKFDPVHVHKEPAAREMNVWRAVRNGNKGRK